MKRESLQYYIHDEADALRFELSGSLSGEGARSVYQAWRTALSIVAGRPVIADITFVTEADEHGRGVLLVWHRSGVRIIAASPESRVLARDILGEPISPPPVKVRGFRGWITSLFAGPAVAESRADLSARARRSRAEATGNYDFAQTEYRLP
jgi:hypothetical protein